jgi:GH43 family beta-xylosidase
LTGEWTFKGKVADPSSDKWAIDASVFENNGQLYMIWSGWEGDENGAQNIYIAPMSNPWTISGPRVLLSYSKYPWEKVGDLIHVKGEPPHVDVNEGPEVLKHGDDIFLTYSASGCWTDYYELGLLRAKADANLLDPSAWTKSKTPVLTESAEGHAYGTGHNGFFKSADGTQDWIINHANNESGQGCGDRRNPRAQPISWNPDGTPNFGRPVGIGVAIPRPSGDTIQH